VGGLSVSDQFYWNQALIVIWRNHDIKLSGVCTVIQAVGRMRTANCNSLAYAMLDRRPQNLIVLGTKHPTFAGVRIDRCHSNARISLAKPGKLFVDERDQTNIPFRRQLFDGL